MSTIAVDVLNVLKPSLKKVEGKKKTDSTIPADGFKESYKTAVWCSTCFRLAGEITINMTRQVQARK